MKTFGLVLMGTLVFIGIMTLPGCAHPGRHQGGNIIVDTKNTDMEAYYQDLHECRNYASQVNVGEKVATKAATGAVVGGAIGAIIGDSGSAGRGAGVGGVLGAVKGVGQGHREKQQVVRNCLRGRGYHVLN